MRTSNKILLATAVIGSFSLGGLAQNAYATQPQTSILVAQTNDSDGESNEDAKEQQEEANLQSLAKITAQQALQVAETAFRR